MVPTVTGVTSYTRNVIFCVEVNVTRWTTIRGRGSGSGGLGRLRWLIHANFFLNEKISKEKNMKKNFNEKKHTNFFGVNQPPTMADLRQRFTKKHWRESAT